MKILSLIGLSAAGILAAFVSTPVLAQSASPEFLTCRTALEGVPFEEVDLAEAPSCCYVVEEILWYSENDVLLNRFYQNTDDRIHYTTDLCKPTVHWSDAFGPAVDPTTTGSVGVKPPINGGPEVVSPPADDDTTPPSPTNAGPGNPGNENPVGGAGEHPNGTDFGPVPAGTKGKSDS